MLYPPPRSPSDGFRGSQPDMLERIATHWNCTSLTLPNNYRCCPSIVKASKLLMKGEITRAGDFLFKTPAGAELIARALHNAARLFLLSQS